MHDAIHDIFKAIVLVLSEYDLDSEEFSVVAHGIKDAIEPKYPNKNKVGEIKDYVNRAIERAKKDNDKLQFKPFPQRLDGYNYTKTGDRL